MLDRDAVIALARAEADPAVTITLPTFRRMPEAQQNAIRFKNLLTQARERLGDAAVRGGAMAARMAEAEALIGDYDFWQNQKDGLAVFVTPGQVRAERVDHDLPETASVGAGFAITPLLALLEPERHYYVLAAAWENVRLFRQESDGLREVRGEDLPESIEKLIGISEVEGNVHHHPSGPARTTGGTPSAKFHSLGTAPPEEMEKIQQSFARSLAKEVDNLLRAEPKMRLVLIADERLTGMIGQHVKTGLIRTPETRVSPAEMTEDRIRAVAASAAEAGLAGDDGAELETLRAHLQDSNSELASTDAATIASAVVMGRVAELFVDTGQRPEGSVDPATGEIRTGNGGDLAEDLVRLTLRGGGEVRTMRDQDYGLAALFRF